MYGNGIVGPEKDSYCRTGRRSKKRALFSHSQNKVFSFEVEDSQVKTCPIKEPLSVPSGHLKRGDFLTLPSSL
jgi:hypothetical protein